MVLRRRGDEFPVRRGSVPFHVRLDLQHPTCALLRGGICFASFQMLVVPLPTCTLFVPPMPPADQEIVPGGNTFWA